MVGRGLQREVQRHLHAQLAVRATKASKSAMVPSSGWTASCPPSALPIAHGEPTSPSTVVRVLFLPLRLTVPIGWIGAGRRRRTPSPRSPAAAGRVGEGAVGGHAVDDRPLGAGEELVPGAVERPLAVDPHLVAGRAGDQPAHGVGVQQVGHRRGQRRASRAVSSSDSSRSAVAAAATAVRCSLGTALPTSSSRRAPSSRSLARSAAPCPASTLTSTAWCQVPTGSSHASTWKVHRPSPVGDDVSWSSGRAGRSTGACAAAAGAGPACRAWPAGSRPRWPPRRRAPRGTRSP